jgi:branched-chain amino acid aminotransferase
MRRLIDSARIYRMEPAWDQQTLTDAVIDLIKVNEFKACYIRPLVYRGYDSLGVNPGPCPIDVAIMLWEWGAYFSQEALEEGLDVKVSTWARNAPNTTPAMAKSVANYANAQLIKMEAMAEGYGEGIALDTSGNVSEASGANIFIVRDGVILTPPIGNSVLSGITRDSVITLAQEFGSRCASRTLPAKCSTSRRGLLRGHAPRSRRSARRSRDGRPRAARPSHGRIAQQRFFQIVKGRHRHPYGWPARLSTCLAASGAAKSPIIWGVCTFNDLLKSRRSTAGASDLHLKVGSLPDDAGPRRPCSRPRRTGRLEHEGHRRHRGGPSCRHGHRERFKDSHEVDLAYSVSGGSGRFRCNAFQQRGTDRHESSASSRCGPPTIEELLLPPVLKIDCRRGARPDSRHQARTGAARARRLAALINEINDDAHAHIITIEDPIEYLHRDHRSIDSTSARSASTPFSIAALRSGAASGSDVILVGEMRDFETIQTALHAAETGHLVLSTCTRLTPPKPSTASFRCSRRISRSRFGCSSRASLRASSRSG